MEFQMKFRWFISKRSSPWRIQQAVPLGESGCQNRNRAKEWYKSLLIIALILTFESSTCRTKLEAPLNLILVLATCTVLDKFHPPLHSLSRVVFGLESGKCVKILLPVRLSR